MRTAKKTRPTTDRMPAIGKDERPRWQRVTLAILKWGSLAGLLLAAIGGATIAILFWVYGSDPDLPKIAGLKDYHPKQTTRILSSDGKLIGEIYAERRTFVPIDKIAPIMIDAVIDAEDADFRTHEGFNVMGIARALWVDLRSGGHARQGASTITQQVVKTFLLGPQKTVKRKVQELILARRIEKALTKDEILALYLNQIYYGHGRYGVEEAARFYFGKSASELDAGEAAMLAGLPQSPERLSPFKHPEAAKARQTYVLEQMAKHHHISDADAEKFIQAPITIVRDSEPYLEAAPEIVEIVRKELVSRYGEDKLPTLGLTVRTTIDVGLETQARSAVEAGLRSLDERHGYRGATAHLTPDDAAKKLAELAKGGSNEAVVVDLDDTKGEMLVDEGAKKCGVILSGIDDDRYNPDHKKPSERFKKYDVVKVKPAAPDLGKSKMPGAQAACSLDLGPQGAMVVIDPGTRHVLALVGGYHYQLGDFDRALRAKRQPGSSFKPFVYTAAMDSGEFTPASIVNDAPEVYQLWKPQNFEKEEFKGPVRLRDALAFSINTVAIRVLHDISPKRAIEVAHAMGITSELPEELSLALGSGAVAPIELVNAYTTFAAGGVYQPPQFLFSIGDGTSVDIEKPGDQRQAIRPEVAYLMTNMMESVVDEGTGAAAKKLKREIAGKTGTSNDQRDAWFLGFTPDLVAGVWVGFDDNATIGRGEQGATAALPIWIDFMKGALRGKAQKGFHAPPGITVARIDKATGKLAAPSEPDSDVISEVFLDGTAPTEVAPAPGEVDPTKYLMGDPGAQ